MLDSFSRNVRYLRVSVTDRCNLRCSYCMPPEGVPCIPHERILSYERIAEVARAAIGLGFDKVRLTGGEPLVRRGLPGLVSLLREIPGDFALAMTTNGTLLAPVARELRARGLDSVNVSLDTLDPDRYRELTRGGDVRDALAGIEAALDAGLPVKLNVVVPGAGALFDLEAVAAYAGRVGARVQTIARYALGEEKADGGDFDRPPPCAACDRLRLLADGTLRPCLHGDGGFPVDFADVEGSITKAILEKPARGRVCAAGAVSSIGG